MTRATGVGIPGRIGLFPMRNWVVLVAGLISLSAAISAAEKWFGHMIALGGHSDDRTVHEIVIGNNVVAVPANAIRFNRDRRSVAVERLELYLMWPGLEGYSAENRSAFNSRSKNGSIIYLTFEPRTMSRDMSGRFEPVYRALIEQPGRPGPGEITFYAFSPKSGYIDEELAAANRGGKAPFVARCLKDEQARQLLAECQRDIILTDDLSLSYRFPSALLANWRELDDAIFERARHMLQTGGSAQK